METSTFGPVTDWNEVIKKEARGFIWPKTNQRLQTQLRLIKRRLKINEDSINIMYYFIFMYIL